MSKAILIKTDGYSINHQFYGNYEAAKAAMDAQYADLTPDEWIEEFEELSGCYEHGATLYQNGEDVYLWSIILIPDEKKEEQESPPNFEKERAMSPAEYLKMMTGKDYVLSGRSTTDEIQAILDDVFGEGAFWSYPVTEKEYCDNEGIKVVLVNVTYFENDALVQEMRYFQVNDSDDQEES